jgi:hypothetical protein
MLLVRQLEFTLDIIKNPCLPLAKINSKLENPKFLLNLMKLVY